MIKRLLIITAVLLVLTLAIQGCNPGIDYYTSMQVENVDGRPYLITQYVTSSTDDPDAPYYFSIYTPSEKGPIEWDPVAEDRLGHAWGLFQVKPSVATATVTPAPTPTPPTPTQPTGPEISKGPEVAPKSASTLLGILHGSGDSTWFDLSARPPVSSPHHVAFDWQPLATATMNGTPYTFGVGKPDPDEKKASYSLLAAKRDGDTWTELKVTSPNIKSNMDVNAVALGNSIKVLWRGAEDDRSLGFEGQRYTTDGPLAIATFNGTDFSPDLISVNKLPRGNASFWIHDAKIRCVIQTRAKLEQSMAANGPMEIWDIDPANGNAEMVERIEGSQSKPGLMAFIAAEHFAWNEKEFILRSNWQMFEVWQRNDHGWQMIQSNPKGLPTFDLESMLWTGLGIALGLVIFGALVAYRRRKHAWTLMRKIQAHEIYATLLVRAGAYLIDITLIVAASMLFGKLSGIYVSPAEMVTGDFTRLPYWPFFGIYMVYLCGCEWLLGRTLGKAIMGLSVVMDEGKPLSFTAALVRNLVGFAERIPHIVVLFVFPMILLSPRRQRLGDILSQSFVVNKSALEMFKQQRAQELAKLQAEGAAFPPPPEKLTDFVDLSGKDKKDQDRT